MPFLGLSGQGGRVSSKILPGGVVGGLIVRNKVCQRGI